MQTRVHTETHAPAFSAALFTMVQGLPTERLLGQQSGVLWRWVRDKGLSKLVLCGPGFNLYHFRETPTKNDKNLIAKCGTPMRQNTIQP